jgi:hypothetical protein
MRFRQKPPTKPGYYWALGNNDDELMQVLVRESDGRLYVEIEDDYGGSEDSLSEYRLWSANPIAPVEPPALRMPKRWINYHRPVKTPLPKSCRRWGHKFVWDGDACGKYNESIKPVSKPDSADIFGPASVEYMLNAYSPDTFLKCSRCDAKDIYNSRTRNMFDNMFSTTYFTEPVLDVKYTTYADVQNELAEKISPSSDKP